MFEVICYQPRKDITGETLGSSLYTVFGCKSSKPFVAAVAVFFQSHFLLIQHTRKPWLGSPCQM